MCLEFISLFKWYCQVCSDIPRLARVTNLQYLGIAGWIDNDLSHEDN